MFESFIEDGIIEGVDLTDYSSYVEPTDFATVEIEFTYEDQYSSIYFYLAYADNQFYIYDWDTDYFDIEFETETPSGEVSEFDFETSLAENYVSLDLPTPGTAKQFDGYTLTIPDTWTITETNCCSPDSMNFITFSNYKDMTPESKIDTLKDICNVYLTMGFTDFEFGNLTVNGKNGYYIEGNYFTSYVCLFMFANDTDDKLFTAIITSDDTTLDSFDEALGVAASLEIQ